MAGDSIFHLPHRSLGEGEVGPFAGSGRARGCCRPVCFWGCVPAHLRLLQPDPAAGLIAAAGLLGGPAVSAYPLLAMTGNQPRCFAHPAAVPSAAAGSLGGRGCGPARLPVSNMILRTAACRALNCIRGFRHVCIAERQMPAGAGRGVACRRRLLRGLAALP